MASSCLRGGLGWVSGKMFLLKEWSGIGIDCWGTWLSPHPWRGSIKVSMWHFRTWFSRHDGVGLAVGLDDLQGLFQSMILWFYDRSVSLLIDWCHQLWSSPSLCPLIPPPLPPGRLHEAARTVFPLQPSGLQAGWQGTCGEGHTGSLLTDPQHPPGASAALWLQGAVSGPRGRPAALSLGLVLWLCGFCPGVTRWPVQSLEAARPHLHPPLVPAPWMRRRTAVGSSSARASSSGNAPGSCLATSVRAARPQPPWSSAWGP